MYDAASWSAGARRLALRTLETVPPAYCAIMRRRHPEWRVVDPRVDLVIEGYQSSANTFARMAAEHSNPGIVVASHVHSWAHVAQARILRKPVIVLLRNPVDAISSHAVRMQLNDLGHELQRYRTFYRRVWPLRSQVVVAPFETVTARFGDVMDAVNQRFGASFKRFDHENADANAAIFDQMDREMDSIGASWQVAHPKQDRGDATDAVRARLQSEPHRRALADCQAVYERLHAVSSLVAS
jgi:hypothetical protein